MRTARDVQARAGFTLVELLVVIGILVFVTGMIVWGVASTRGTDKARSAARTAQSAFLGARDRAVHAKEMRGLRLLRDPNDFTVVTGFHYIRPLPPLTYGGLGAPFEVLRPDVNPPIGTADSPDATILHTSATTIDWFALDSNGLFDPLATRIRIPSGQNGTWYRPVAQQQNAPYFVRKNGNDQLIFLSAGVISATTPAGDVVAIPAASPGATMDIQLGNELIPLTEPISMSSGMVIDLEWSSATAKVLAIPKVPTDPIPAIDIMFSPRGGVTGPISVGGPIHFLLTDAQDAASLDPNDPTKPMSPIDFTPPANSGLKGWKNRGEKLVLTIFPQTGNVQTFPIDPTDVVDNSNGNSGADGLPDDMFRFARLGSAAN